MTNFFLLSLFGVGGVGLRYAIFVYSSMYVSSIFPFGTLFINLVGSFLIGIVYVIGIEYAKISPLLSLCLMTGFLGGFTTFSAFSLETIRLLEKGFWMSACIYAIVSSVFGIGCAWGGMSMTRWYFSR